MKLFFLRHGQALPHRDDNLRPLSEVGIAQVQQCAKAAAAAVGSVSKVFVSPYLRAQQTCEVFCQTINFSIATETVDWLTPDTPPREVVKQLLLEQDDILLVSHQPLANALLAYLDDSDVAMAFLDTANLVGLEGETVAHAAMQAFIRVDNHGVSALR